MPTHPVRRDDTLGHLLLDFDADHMNWAPLQHMADHADRGLSAFEAPLCDANTSQRLGAFFRAAAHTCSLASMNLCHLAVAICDERCPSA